MKQFPIILKMPPGGAVILVLFLAMVGWCAVGAFNNSIAIATLALLGIVSLLLLGVMLVVPLESPEEPPRGIQYDPTFAIVTVALVVALVSSIVGSIRSNFAVSVGVLTFVVIISVTWMASLFIAPRRESVLWNETLVRAEKHAADAPERAKPAWDLARLTLESYFSRNLSQITWIFWLSLAVMIAGFCVIVWGIAETLFIIARLIDKPDIQKDIPNFIKALPGVAATVAGLVTEFIGATFLFIYRSTMQQATNYSRTLERINSIGMAMQILDTLAENATAEDLKSHTKARVVDLLVRGSYQQKLESEGAHGSEKKVTPSRVGHKEKTETEADH